jgi:hypothetical protein
MINIDQLSNSENYLQEITSKLQMLGIDGVDFSDCSIPQAYFDTNDIAFFDPVENRVHDLLIASGCPEESINEIRQMRQKYAPQYLNDDCATLARDLSRTRAIVLHLETTNALQQKQRISSL